MATRKEDRLQDKEVTRIASEISTKDMVFIAVLYMDIDLTKLENLSPERTSAELYNADIIRIWRNRKTGDKKVKYDHYNHCTIKKFNVGKNIIKCECSTFEESGGRMHDSQLTVYVHPDQDSQMSILGWGERKDAELTFENPCEL